MYLLLVNDFMERTSATSVAEAEAVMKAAAANLNI